MMEGDADGAVKVMSPDSSPSVMSSSGWAMTSHVVFYDDASPYCSGSSLSASARRTRVRSGFSIRELRGLAGTEPGRFTSLAISFQLRKPARNDLHLDE